MPLAAVVGGQFGGEGKGLITIALAASCSARAAVKAGGPNSLHRIRVGGRHYALRMVPSPATIGVSELIFPAGCLLNPAILLDELSSVGYSGTVLIDSQCGIIDDELANEQRRDSFYGEYGSTLTGSGLGSSLRCLRRLTTAKQVPSLRTFLGDAASRILRLLQEQANVIIEGGQAFGLSNYHGTYPYVTSRDTTVSAVLSQVGIGPRFLDYTVLALKCFPTRNLPGHSPLANELDMPTLSTFGDELTEFGGGSYGEEGKVRRVGLFDMSLVRRACQANTPDAIALTGLDHLSALIQSPDIRRHYTSVTDFCSLLENTTGAPLRFESWGPALESVKDRCPELGIPSRND